MSPYIQNRNTTGHFPKTTIQHFSTHRFFMKIKTIHLQLG